MRRMLLVLLLPTLVHAASLSCPSGLLTPTAQTTTGASANSVSGAGYRALVFQVSNTAGNATTIIEMCCLASCAPAAAWAKVETSDMGFTGAGSLVKSVLAPTCEYRANTSCAGCSVTVAFVCSAN